MTEKVYVVGGNDDGDIETVNAFLNREDALEYAGRDDLVHECLVHEGKLPSWTYYKRRAKVFPDGGHEESNEEQICRGNFPISDDYRAQPVVVLPLDKTRDRRYHGNINCGDQIHVAGSNQALVEQTFQQQLREVIALQTGVCPYAVHDGDVDGVTLFAYGYDDQYRRMAREAKTGALVELKCGNWREHLFGPPSKADRVEIWETPEQQDGVQQKRYQLCARCHRQIVVQIMYFQPSVTE